MWHTVCQEELFSSGIWFVRKVFKFEILNLEFTKPNFLLWLLTLRYWDKSSFKLKFSHLKFPV